MTGKSGAGKQVGFRFYGGCRVMRANMTEWEIDVPNSPVWGVVSSQCVNPRDLR